METSVIHRTFGWGARLLCAVLGATSVLAAQSPDQPATPDSKPLEEVVVEGKTLSKSTLDRAAMKFVESHAVVSLAIHQIGRWRDPFCPQVTGLAPAATEFVAKRLEEVARNVGAPTPRAGRPCEVDVEVVFTREPQPLLDHIAKTTPVLLGSSRSAGDTKFSHAIQSWYLTQTRSTAGYKPPADQQDTTLLERLSDAQVKGSIANLDPAYGLGAQPSGLTGSYFTKGLASDFSHVLVIVDAGQVAAHSLRSIADYIAMLTLTRMQSLDACGELPSVLDLLASRCDKRDKPASLTPADTAYLKALYTSDLEANLNVEQANMRDRMVSGMLGK